MMQRVATYNFLHDEDLSCSVVEMSYPEDVVAWFILPDKGKLKDIESSLVKEDLDKWRTSFQYRGLRLQIPKFSISASSDIKDFLQRLGVTNVDLSGITRKYNLRISETLHEAALEVDEDNAFLATTSLSGSYYPFSLYGVQPICTPPPPPPLITFNRPFLLVITDTSTGTILFMGKIVNPTSD